MFSFGKTIQYRSTFFLNNNQIMLCLRNTGKERLPGEDVLPEGNLCLERTFCRKGTFALLGSFAGKEHLLGKCISEQNSVSATSLNDKSSAKRMSYVVMKKRE